MGIPVQVNVTTEERSGTVCIFGTGDFGCSLGLRLLQAGYEVIYGSRDPKCSTRVPKGSKVMTHTHAAHMAEVIFIAVQRDHYDFLTRLAPVLEGKVLVDISNNLKRGQFKQSNAEYLSSLVPGALVVKGFNTVSAWALQSGALDASKQVLVCGDDRRAKLAVVDIAQSLGFTAQDRGSLRAAGELEDIPLQLLPKWRLPLWIVVGLNAVFFAYVLVYDVIWSYVEKKQNRIYRIMISVPNVVFPICALIMLALCYLPGAIAAILQLHNGTKYKRFPDWLDRWMLCRKQLGLLALALACLHVLYTFVKPLRYSTIHGQATDVIDQIKKNVTDPFDHAAAWRSESYKSVGILGFALFLLLGITSLPSVSNSLNWREFRFVQSKLGHLTLVLCTGHCLLYGWDRFLQLSRYHWYMPPPYMLALVIPCAVMVLKFILITPCIDRRITQIRNGRDTSKRSRHNQITVDAVTSL